MRKILLFICLFQFSLSAMANHRAGGSYTWTCVGPNQYKIRFTALTDCSNSPDDKTKICLNGSLGGDPNNGTYTVNFVSSASTEIPHTVAFCPGILDCQNNGDYNWVTEIVYETTITLVAPISPSYTISFCDGGKRPNSDNFGGADDFYNEAVFNTTTPCNSSAYPTNFPDVFYCNGQASTIINNFVDPDGDSLAFSLVNCLDDAGVSVGYTAPYTGTNPLNSTAGWTINSQGNISFSPGVIMKGPVCMKVKEYRGGVLIATTTQDIFINVIDCPYALTGPTISSITSTSVKCFGGNTGTATVTATGGATPYTYSWAPSGGNAATANGLTAGTYTATVTSATGCAVTATVAVAQPAAPLSATLVSTNITCNGAGNGTATVTASGGTSGYTYSWAPSGGTNASASNFTPGNYTVTITDANLCTTTASVNFSNPAVLSVSINSSIDVTCFGGNNGSANANANGGTTPYSYSWNTTPVQTTVSATGLTAGGYTITVTDAKGCTATKTVTISQPSVLALTTSQTNVSCFNGNNGSASVSVSGGSPGYNYNWVPSGGTGASTPSNLTDGSYTVVVTDNKSCTANAVVTITQPAAIFLIMSTTNVSCNGGTTGSATVSASGGTPGYIYSWAPSGGNSAIANNLSSGNYTVTVTDTKGCTSTGNAAISQPTALAALFSTTNVSCNGGSDGSATVSVSGGTTPYTYLWSPGISTISTSTGLSMGTYTVTVTDNKGCVILPTVAITQPASVSVSVAVTNISCSGGNNGTATVTASGGTSPYTYSWSTSPVQTAATANNLSAGTYTVTVTDFKGCTASAIATLTQPPALSASISSSTNVSCYNGNNGSATVSVGGGNPGYTYNWIPSGGITSVAANLIAGSYTVNITDTKGCTISASVAITQPVAPLSAVITSSNVSCNGGSNGSASVTASGGTPGYSYTWSPAGGNASLATGLTAGSYTVAITDNKGCTVAATTTISQPSGMTLTTSSVNAFCGTSNGQVSVSVTGGNPVYTYSWNSAPVQTTSAATGLFAGSYVVTVTDASGCTANATVIVSNNAAPSASIISTTPVYCNGGTNGTATGNVTGGVAPYTYSWSPAGGNLITATGLSASSYTLTVTDANGCIATVTTTITQPTSFSLTTSSTNVSCSGGTDGSATVVASGGTPGYTYNWSPSGGAGSTANNVTAGNYTVSVTDNNGCNATASVSITQPLVLSATTSINNMVACFGGSNGSASVNTTGGTPGYVYSWSPTGGNSPSAVGLFSDSYTVTVTDSKGCQTTAIANITQPTAIAISISSTDVLCSGGSNGSASATASNGTAPYTYFWAPAGITGANATGLTAGTYTVTATDANSCQSAASVTITEPTSLTVSTSITNVSCFSGNNGAAASSVSGGTIPYSYSWSTVPIQMSTTATGLSAGNYTLSVTDNKGCVVVATTTISQPPPISLTISQTNVSCNGGSNGSASVSASGGTPGYTYNWSPTGGITSTATGLSAGNYTVTVTDTKSCTAVATVTITQPTQLSSSITASSAVSCNGGSNGSATASTLGGTPSYSYLWAPSGGTSSFATGLATGLYTVTVTDIKGCISSSTVSITQPSALTASVASVTNVSCNGGNNGSATVSALGGASPYTYSWSPYGGTAPTANALTAGAYTVTVKDANSCSYSITVAITEPSPLTVVTASTNVSCNNGNNGTATVTASGGSLPYSYVWSTVPAQTNSTAINLTPNNYSVTVTDAKGCTAVSIVTITAPSALFITSTQVNVSCNGGSNGSASVNVSGGTPVYAYNWKPTGGNAAAATGLIAGIYTIVITDAAGCKDSSSLTITQPTALSASVAINNQVSCNGGNNGSATMNVSGGTPGYSYNWTPGGGASSTENNLSAATYTVVTTDFKGCTITNTFMITQPAVMNITISQVNVSCYGGSNGASTVSVTGGTSPYIYQWLPSGGVGSTATGLYSGTYTVTVTDAKGCNTAGVVTITQPSPLSLVLTSSSNVTCYGACNGSAQISVSGGTAPYAYLWSPGAQVSAAVNNLCAGTHTVTVTDAKGCAGTITVTITQPVAITATSTVTNVNCYNACNGVATVVASGGTGPYSFLWNPGFQTTTSVNNLCAGTYTVTITDASGCFVNVPIVITQPTLTTLTTSITNANCGSSDGGACVFVTGGAPPFTYLWNDPLTQTTSCASALTGNAYTVTVTDANGCINQTVANVNNISAAIVTIATSSNITCAGANNGTATGTISGGVPPYTILWSPSGQTTAFASGLASGIHTIKVTDNVGCVSSASITLNQPVVLGSAIVSSVNANCNGTCNGSATVAAGGGTAPYTYFWNTTPAQTGATANSLCTGAYTITITDANSCSATNTTTITQPLSISIGTTAVTNVSCNGGNNGSIQVSATGGTPGYTYSWVPIGGSGPVANGLSAGNYTLTVTDVNGCTATATYAITQPTVLSTAMAQTNVSCYGYNNGTATVTVSGGTLSYTYSWSSFVGNSSSVDSLVAGTYIVTATDANGCNIQDTATITQPSPLVVTSSSTIVTCFGGNNGSAAVAASGGTSGYTYLWSTIPLQTTAAITNLTAGSYTYTVTDANGCSETEEENVYQNSAVSVSTTSSGVSCNGGSNGSVSAIVLGGTPGYSYQWIPGSFASSTVNALPAGTYTVTVTDALGCLGTNTAIVTQPAVLSATATVVNNVSCNSGNNGSLLGTAAGGTPGYFYVWSPSGGTMPVSSNLYAGTYMLTITDSKNCQATVTASITQPPAASINVSQNNLLCFGGTNGSASATVTGGTPGYNYLWSPTGSTNASVIGLSAGNYTLTITDTNGCSENVPLTITQPPLLTASVPFNSDVSCFGLCNGSSIAASSGGTPPYNYLWLPNNQASASINNLCIGSYTAIVTDMNGCQSTSSININQPTALSSMVSSSNATCFNSCDGTAGIVAAGGVGPYTFQWSPGGQTTPTIAGLCAGTYSVTVTDNNGCTQSAAISISQPTAISATLTIASTCGYSNGSIAAATTGGTSPYSYLWNDALLQTSSAAINLTAGTYKVTVTDANGCVFTDSALVPASINPVITSITGVSPACYGSFTGAASVTVASGTLPYNYQWNDPFNQTSPTANSLGAGMYTVVVTDNKGCTATDSINLTQPTQVQANINANDSSLCYGQFVQLFASGVGGNPGYVYNWSTGYVGTGPVTTSPTTTTIYSVYVVDTSGCQSAPAFVTVTVNAPLAVTAPNVSACEGVPVNISANTVGGTGGPYTYTWSNGFIGQTQQVTLLATDTYVVTVGDGCSSLASDTLTVTVNPVAVGSMVLSDTTGCVPFAVQFNASSDIGTTYTWNFGDFSTVMNGQNVSHTYSTSGSYQVTLTITTAIGCQTIITSTQLITVKPSPTANFTVSPSITPILNTSTIYFTNLSIGAASYTWSFGDGNSSNAVNPNHFYAISSDYTILLVAFNSIGCTDTFRMKSTSENYIHFANAFTPNPNGGNGGTYNFYDLNNDVFFPTWSGVEDYHLTIYNKWGEMIFETFDINKGWDGYYRGKIVEQDVYVWKAFATFKDGTKYIKAGDVTLLR